MADDWPAHLPLAPVIAEVPAPADGVVSAVDAELLGLAVVALGGGRQVESDRIDPAVGLSALVPLGTKLQRGDPLAVVHARSDAAAEAAAQAVRAACTLGTGAAPLPLVLERI